MELPQPPISEVEAEYRRRIFALPVHERIARMARMYGVAKSNIARRIEAEHGPMSDRRLRLMVARHLYSADAEVRSWIDRELEDVPD